MKRRIFSAFLTASMLLTQSALVFATESTDTISTVGIPYTQNFEDATLKATDFTGKIADVTAEYFEQKTENENGYGHFHDGNKGWYRIGLQADEKGVTDGKLKVSFRFRPYGLSEDRKQLTFVALGDTTGKETSHFALLGISGGTALGQMGVTQSNGTSYPMLDAEGEKAQLTVEDAGKWFTYNAVIDLDTRSLDVEVVREEDDAKYTYSINNMKVRDGSGWSSWPTTVNFQTFVTMGPIDIDDLSITHILKAQKLTFVSANGAESDECSVLTPNAKVTFNTAVKTIGENAITVDGMDCSGGVLSEDGKSYTFDISKYLNSGTAHDVAVDTSKLETALDGVIVGDSYSFAFTVSSDAVYSQNFEDSALKASNYSGGANAVTSDVNFFEQKIENENGYGHFHNGNKGWYRIGFQTDENGINNGKLNVSFRFRPYGLSEDRKQLTFIGLGDETSTTTDYLTLLGVSGGEDLGKMGVMESNGKSNPMKDADGANAVLTSADAGKWFTYNAVIDLDTRSLKVEVVREENGAKYTYSKTGIAKRTAVKNGWGNWPINTSMKKFVAMGPVDIDDLSIKHILKAQKLTFVSANGAESNGCSIFTPKAKVEFNMAVKSIGENAVTMDGKACTGGVLAADGMSYTFDIPENLVSGTAHSIAVDTSKIEAVLDVVFNGEGENFNFTVAATDVKAPVYTQNFEDTALKAANYSGGATSATSDVNFFEQKIENENGYGHFHNGNKGWYRIGFQVDKNGVKEGKLNVSFRFRPYGLSEDRKQLTFIGLGDETSTTTDYLTLLGISGDADLGKMGVMESNGKSNPMQASDGTNAVLTSADAEKWFTYNAVIDLDTRSLEVEVVREEDGAKYTYSKTGIAKRTVVKNGWGAWPINTSMKKFVAMGPVDIDDFSMTYDTNPAIVADEAGVKTSVIAATEGDNQLIIAQYDESGNLVDITRTFVALENGQSTILEADVAWKDNAKTAKAFVWDNFMNCTPLSKAKLASKPLNE